MSRTTWFQRNWLLLFSLGWGTFVLLPFLAPVFMQLGWPAAGLAIYRAYSLTCHQMPQRSFFLFGEQAMYSLEQIQAIYQNTNNPLLLRQFVGSEAVGWKVAWSDRMVSMYTGILPAAWLWPVFRRRLRRLSFKGLILFLLPMVIDGSTHVISDLSGIGQGFRDTNEWLLRLTGGIFSPSFYMGDALGSFNSWMRLLTGLLFAAGIIWFLFSYIDDAAMPGAD